MLGKLQPFPFSSWRNRTREIGILRMEETMPPFYLTALCIGKLPRVLQLTMALTCGIKIAAWRSQGGGLG